MVWIVWGDNELIFESSFAVLSEQKSGNFYDNANRLEN